MSVLQIKDTEVFYTLLYICTYFRMCHCYGWRFSRKTTIHSFYRSTMTIFCVIQSFSIDLLHPFLESNIVWFEPKEGACSLTKIQTSTKVPSLATVRISYCLSPLSTCNAEYAIFYLLFMLVPLQNYFLSHITLVHLPS